MRYRRDRTCGATYFFTVVTFQRAPLFANADHLARLRAAFRDIRAKHPFAIDAMVVLPEHLHCLWTLPAGDDDYPLRWSLIKGAFTRSLPDTDKRPRASRRQFVVSAGATDSARREQAVWQRRYWEHRIRDDDDYARHCDYIHWNPVRHGLVERAADWPHSSFGRFVAAGFYPSDWGGAEPEMLDFPAGE